MTCLHKISHPNIGGWLSAPFEILVDWISHSELSCFCCLIKHMDTLFHKINSGLQLNPQEIFFKSVWGRVKWDSSWMSDRSSPLVSLYLRIFYHLTTAGLQMFLFFSQRLLFFYLLLLPLHYNTRWLRKNKKKSRNIPVGKISDYYTQSVGVS